MAASPIDEMEYDEDLGPISEECTTAINHVIPYQMFISDVYLSMACSYAEEMEMPNFAVFFEDQAEVRRYQVKRFLRYLRNRKSIICLPVIQVPYLDKWENDEQALNSALKAEIELTKILEDLQTVASQAVDTHLLKFVEGYLIKQKRNTTYLEREITYQKQLQELKEQELKEQELKEQELREQQMREQQEQEMKEKEQGQEMGMETKETKEQGKEQGPEQERETKETKEQGPEQEPEQEQDMKKKEQGPEQETKEQGPDQEGAGDKGDEGAGAGAGAGTEARAGD